MYCFFHTYTTNLNFYQICFNFVNNIVYSSNIRINMHSCICIHLDINIRNTHEYTHIFLNHKKVNQSITHKI